MTERTESAVRLVILLAIGTMAGAAAFTTFTTCPWPTANRTGSAGPTP
ncbi:hypothetical protein [Micromonospora sp. NPDC023633]